MIPGLQKLYGGDPMAWFRMPISVLRAYMEMAPRLLADGWLQGVAVTMVGTGSMRKADSQRMLGRWQRIAGGTARAERLSEPDKVEAMKALGITVV